MSVYVVAQLVINDAERYGRYVQGFAPTLVPFGGILRIADTSPRILEGEWPFHKIVVIEFPSETAADRWAASDAYRAVACDRVAATTATIIRARTLVEARTVGTI